MTWLISKEKMHFFLLSHNTYLSASIFTFVDRCFFYHLKIQISCQKLGFTKIQFSTISAFIYQEKVFFLFFAHNLKKVKILQFLTMLKVKFVIMGQNGKTCLIDKNLEKCWGKSTHFYLVAELKKAAWILNSSICTVP